MPDPTMRPDVDIMGVQRGAHQDGEDICKGYRFKIPGGTNPDGSKLWGWNDVGGAYCARCGRRDTEHLVIRDWTKEQMAKDREKEQDEKWKKQAGVKVVRAGNRRPVDVSDGKGGGGDATAANPVAANPSLSSQRQYEATTPMQMFELEPGVPDPLAINAYKDAERERSARLAEKRRIETQAAVEAAAAAVASKAEAPATGAVADDENEKFKAEVERMVREQMAKERLDVISKEPAAGALTVSSMLTQLGLSQYIEGFESEGMEMSVLVALAKSEDGKLAVDEALKEVGVKSVGHRLKIFAALQN